MKTALLVCILTVSNLFVQVLHAQQTQTDSSAQRKIQLKVSANYNSGLNYYGRTDSLKSSSFFPLAEVWLNSKFYINAAPVFINNKVQSFEYAGTITSIAFQHISDHWITSINVLKPFYKETTSLPSSVLKMQASSSLTWLNKVANLTAGVEGRLSERMDLGITAGIDKSVMIPLMRNSFLLLNPSVYAYAGTRQFSKSYSRKKSGLIPGLGGQQERVTENYNELVMLSYECSLPLIFLKDKIMVIVTPSYVLPQNLMKDASSPSLNELGENSFYTSVGLKYSF
jgi:hypothetical protein